MNKIKLTLSFLLENKVTLEKVISKHNSTLSTADNQSDNKSTAYGISFFGLITFLMFLPNLFFDNRAYLATSICLIVINSLLSLSFSVCDDKIPLNFIKKYFLSFLYKNNKNDFLINLIYKKHDLITEKSKQTIEDFYDSLTTQESELHNLLLDENEKYTKNHGYLKDYDDIIYIEVKKYLLKHNKEEILNNKDNILGLLDQLIEYYADELTKIYLSKTQLNGKYKNNKINQLNEISKKTTVINKTLIKQI
jgi:hypothetical protein